MLRLVALLAVAALCVTAGTVAAEEPGAENKKVPVLADLELGEHWLGPDVSLEDLQGKVILFVLWGS